MPEILVEPSREYPPPYDTRGDKPSSLIEELEVAGKTAETLVQMGAALELDPEEREKHANLLKEVVKNKKSTEITNVNTAFAAAAFLKTYGQNLAFDAASTRAAVTNKLMEIANCGDPKYELKALELLGKHSDVGLFTERSEITINYKDPGELENAIKERIKRLLNAQIIDVTPLDRTIDDELGVAEPPPPTQEEKITSNISELGGEPGENP